MDLDRLFCASSWGCLRRGGWLLSSGPTFGPPCQADFPSQHEQGQGGQEWPSLPPGSFFTYCHSCKLKDVITLDKTK